MILRFTANFRGKDFILARDNVGTQRKYLIGQNFGGQKCRKSGLLPKILSAEIFYRLKFKIYPVPLPSNHIELINMKFMLKYKTDDKTFSADKIAKISNWWVPKIFVRRKFCPPK